MKYVITFLAGFLICLIFTNSCKNDKIEIKTKEIVKKIRDTIIRHSNVTVTVPKWYKDTKTENELKLEILERENRIKNYKDSYELAINDFMLSDSLLKIEKFKNATTFKNFESVTEDNYLILNTKGIVQGEVKELETFYKIKSQKIEVPIKNKKFSFNAGVGTKINNLSTPVLKFGIGYKNYKIDYLPNEKIGIFSYEINF